MASKKEFRDYVAECLGFLNVTFRSMMGEYLVYYRNKLVALICDDVLLVKQTPTSLLLLPTAQKRYPYEGSKTLMLEVEDLEDKDLMQNLITSLYDEL